MCVNFQDSFLQVNGYLSCWTFDWLNFWGQFYWLLYYVFGYNVEVSSKNDGFFSVV